MAAQFAALGVTVEVEEDEDGLIEVWDINWPSVTAFLGVATQWRVVARGMALQWLGLDYTAVDAFMRRRGLQDGVFSDLQAMEAAALEAFGELAQGGDA